MMKKQEELANFKENKMSTRRVVTNAVVHIILGLLALVWVFPIFWVIMTSFRAEKGSYSTTFFPKAMTVSNYITLFTDTDVFNFPKWFGNTFFIAVFSCVLATFYLVSIAFVMSRLRFKTRKLFLNIALILGMFPGFMSMVAVYYIVKGIGLTEGPLKLLALILLYSGGAGILQFYVAKGFFDTIPKAIDEAAFIDGATKWQVFTRITLPLSKPIIVYTVLQSFMAPWIDFIMAKVIVGADSKYYTVSIGLWNMLTRENIYNWYTRFAAGAVLVSIPIAILFVFMQRFYTDGMTGAVKG